MRMTFALGLAWSLDAIETTVSSLTLLVVKEQFAKTDFDITYINVAYKIGALLGAIVFGILSERCGRRKVSLTTATIYITSSLLNLFIHNWHAMLIFRGLVGFAIGGECGAVSPVLQELLPAQHRGKVCVLVGATWDIASTLAALVMIPALRDMSPRWNWKLGMMIGIGISMCSLIFRIRMPESPRWLLSQRRFDDASAACVLVEDKCTRGRVEGSKIEICSYPLKVGEGGTRLWSVMQLLFASYWLQFIVAGGLTAMQYFEGGGFVGWSMIKFFPYCHVSVETASVVYLFATLVTLISNPLAAWLFDNWGRKATTLFAWTGTAVATILMVIPTKMRTLTPLIILTMLWKFFSAPACNCTMAISAEIFPTAVASVANGITHAIGRLFGAFSQTALVSLYDSRGGHRVHLTLLVLSVGNFVAIALSLLWCFTGREGKHANLETIHHGPVALQHHRSDLLSINVTQEPKQRATVT